jgi:hypothetical protein
MFFAARALFMSMVLACVHTAFAAPGPVPNGFPCNSDDQCASGACSNQKPSTGIDGVQFCMNPSLDCPIPGGNGVIAESEFNFDGRNWYCSRKLGLRTPGPSSAPAQYFEGDCRATFANVNCSGKWVGDLLRRMRDFCGAAGAQCSAAGTTSTECETFCAAVTRIEAAFAKGAIR